MNLSIRNKEERTEASQPTHSQGCRNLSWVPKGVEIWVFATPTSCLTITSNGQMSHIFSCPYLRKFCDKT